MERLGKLGHRREGRGLSERKVSESNPVALLKGGIAGSFDFAQDDVLSCLTTGLPVRDYRDD